MRRLVLRLLERLTDPALGDSIAGDLEEEGRRRARVSPARAIVWFWRELLAISLRALFMRVRDALTVERPLRFSPGWPEYRQALRVLRSNPGVAQTAIAVIALSMALAMTVFAVVLFQQTPYERPHELFRVWPRFTSQQVLGVALLLVCFACVNVSGLVAARSAARARELALRRALGASARDVIALVFAECSLLVGIGTGLGLALAAPALSLAVRLMPPATAPKVTAALDGRVLAFAAVAGAVAIVVVSLWPIVSTLRQKAAPALAEGSYTAASSRTIGQSAAVSLQVAVGLMLTVCGGFVLGSLAHATQSDLGFTPDHVVVLEGTIPAQPGGGRFAQVDTLRQSGAAALDELLARVRSRPGVVAAGATHASILRQRGAGSGYGDGYAITEGFVAALQPRLLRGRWPTTTEIAQGARVAVISEHIARRIVEASRMSRRGFASESAVGHTLRNSYGESDSLLEVVGIASTARYRSWDSTSGDIGQVYAPYRAYAFDHRFTVVVRVTSPQELLAWAISEAGMPAGSLRLTSAGLAEDRLLDTIRSRRFQSWVFGALSTASLAIVGVGIAGLAAMTSARRRREIGIRLTLGATRRRVICQLLREQFLAILAGIWFGLFAGFVATVLVSDAYIYGLQLWDVRVWVAAIGVILVTAAIGLIIPALRASRVDPVAALRCE